MTARLALSAAAVACLAAGCGGGGSAATSQTGDSAQSPAPRRAAAPARLVARRPCRAIAHFDCATLVVPLDHSGGAPGRLRLRVAIQRTTKDPRGVLVALTGGPGQPGVPFVPRIRTRLGRALRGYRLVMLDQRGTGAHALRCPALQRAMGSSDLTVPPANAVTRCAAEIGPARRYFTTADTVGDLDALRAVLGAGSISLDGVSYGTYVAERYALAHPDRTARLVLDSVVPHDNVDPLSLVPMRAVARVLRDACRAQHCPSDPASDLAAVVRARHDGPELLDTLTAFSIVAPAYPGILAALRAARQGHPARLDRIVAAVRRGQRAPAAFLSQGLHASTLCGDLRAPWGGPDAPLPGRETALHAALARLAPAQTYPFDHATAEGNGIAQTCVRWPPVPSPDLPPAGKKLPAVPVLLLAGDHDLSTPLEWARQEAALAPRGNLVVIHGAGHSVQSRSPGATAVHAVTRFLQG